jgi:subtilisin-like proprotein convertase family protein
MDSGLEIVSIEYTGNPASVGFFTDGAPVIGLERGLLMSTGLVNSSGSGIGAESTGVEFASSNMDGQSYDANLSPLVTSPLFDLSRYVIKFRPYGDSIRVRYVFASEEYPEYACTNFNDIFGFFLEGPGFPAGTNIALIPGTALPVSINNIHPENTPVGNCPPAYEDMYHDNNLSNTQPTYDGFLDVFTAEAAVQPCGLYTMTIAIADVADGVFDSGVFLEAHSFGSNPGVSSTIVPGSNVIPENGTALPVSLTMTNIPPTILPLTVKIGGSAENGTDYTAIDSVYTINDANTTLDLVFQPIADTLLEPMDSILITVEGNGCFFNQFVMYIADPDSMFRPSDTLLWENTPITLGIHPIEIADQQWTFENNQSIAIPSEAYIASSIQVSGVLPTEMLMPEQIDQVCININHAWADDLDVFLIAPNGAILELTSDNGGNGDNYTNTCFSPKAENSINNNLPFAPADMAPFSGVFQPEGMWSDLLTSPVNGAWKLGVRDDNAGFAGTLLNWSIRFSGAAVGRYSYAWNTGETTREIVANAPGVYTVTITNAVSAIAKTYYVGLVSGTEQPAGLHASDIRLQPNPVAGDLFLQWPAPASFEQLEVFGMAGDRVLMQNIAPQAEFTRADVSALPRGMYLARLSGPSGAFTLRFLVSK